MYIFQTICALILLALIVFVYVRKWFFKGTQTDSCGCEECSAIAADESSCSCGHDHHSRAQESACSCPPPHSSDEHAEHHCGQTAEHEHTAHSRHCQEEQKEERSARHDDQEPKR